MMPEQPARTRAVSHVLRRQGGHSHVLIAARQIGKTEWQAKIKTLSRAFWNKVEIGAFPDVVRRI